MNSRDLISDLYAHMEWADASVWTAVLASDAAPGDVATRQRLHHIHLVQRAFLSLWQGEPVDGRAGDGLAPAELVDWARGYYPLARTFVADAPNAALDRPVQVPWATQAGVHLGVEPASITLAETMIQVYAHTGHHRGQVMSRLRDLGSTPPLVDYIAWLWRHRPAATWP